MPFTRWLYAVTYLKKGRSGDLSFYARSESFWFVTIISIVAATLVYLPGLHGPFLFDDYANLPSLGDTGPIDNAAAFARYITSGTADPTGRPVSLLTFLVDAHDWPADPYPFKRTNLILHLLNGALLALLLRRLGRILFEGRYRPFHIESAAALGATLWLIHPLFVSTTLYIVQREAMLPATTTLLGLHLWLRTRHLLDVGRVAAAWWTATAIAAVTLIGTLAKANGLLLPLLILTVECCLPNRGTGHVHGRRLLLTCVAVVPSALTGLYLVSQGISNAMHGIPYRDWTLAQRLLTEPRVVWEYLRLLWMPTPFTSGVFNDAWPISTSPWAPWTTLPAIAGLAALGTTAWWLRRSRPALAMGILFFFAGHALESTTVPLELYFEHRNYLPAMLLFWPIALWLTRPAPAPGVPARWRFALAAVIVVALGAMTFANASLWGNGSSQALVWARLNPESPRAQVLAAQTEVERHRPDLAIARLTPLLTRYPHQAQISLNLLSAQCATGAVPATTLDAANISLRESVDTGSLLSSWFFRAIDAAKAGACTGLTLEALDNLARAGAENPRLPVGRVQDLLHVRGQIALAGGNVERASAYFMQATLKEPNPALALTQAAALGSAGFPKEGRAQLAYYASHKSNQGYAGFRMPTLHAWVLRRQGYWEREIARLDATLRSDIMAGSPRTAQ